MKRRYGVVLAVAAAAVALLVARAVREERGVPAFATFQGEAMSTGLALTLPASATAARDAQDVFDLFARLEQDLSEWRPGSPLATVNGRAGGEAVKVPPDLIAVVARGLDVGRRTGGAFDVSWAALWGVWDFRAAEPKLPDPAEIERRRALVDYRRVELDERAGTLRLPAAGMKIGLGGIAKGWALDRAGRLLASRGHADFLLVAGGQVLARGSRGGVPWQVGIRDPRGAADDWFAVIPLRDASTSTSGDYESFFELDGVRYHHILDPATGWPTQGLRSATVVSPDATLADALSTAFLVLGRERALAAAAELGVDALLVDEHGQVAATPGLAQLTLRHAPRP